VREDERSFLRVPAAMMGVGSFGRHSPTSRSPQSHSEGKHSTELKELRTYVQCAVNHKIEYYESIKGLERRFGNITKYRLMAVEEVELGQV
jgi:hypothetical protein